MFPFEKCRFTVLALALGALLLYVRYIDPLVQLSDDLLRFYHPLLKGTAPLLELHDGGIKVIGDVPKLISLENGAVVSFDDEINDSLLQSAASGSLFFSQKAIKLKTAEKIRTFDLEQAQFDNKIIIDFTKIGVCLDRSLFWLKLVAAIGLSLLLFIFLAMLDLFFGAIGLIIDTFRNGPYSFKFYLGYAALYLFVTSSLTCILNLAFGPGRVAFVLCLMTFIVAVNFKIRDALRMRQAAVQ